MTSERAHTGNWINFPWRRLVNFRRNFLLTHPYFSLWWLETTCCVIALGGLLGIVALIHTHEGKPLPQWQFGLTVNAIIAIFTLVIKGAAGLVLAEGISHLKWVSISGRPQSLSTFVAHDNASRGPYGSFELLWKNQYYPRKTIYALPFISSFGALLTILLLLLDPFSQQIIRNSECEVRVPNNSTIARTNVYSEIGREIVTGQRSSNLAVVPVNVRRAVNNGMFASQQPEPAYACDTGNCTFSRHYSTLGYCSSCKDASSEMRIIEYQEEYTTTTDLMFLNFSLALGESNVTLSRAQMIPGRGQQPDLISRTSSSLFTGTDIVMIRYDNTSTPYNPRRNTKGYRCNIVPCVKTFTAKVANGRLEESLVEESRGEFNLVSRDYNRTNVMDRTNVMAFSKADLDCLQTPDQRDILKRPGYHFDDTTRWLPYNVSFRNGSEEAPLYAPTFDANLRASGSPCATAPGNTHPDLCSGNDTTRKAFEAVPAKCIYTMYTDSIVSLQTNLFDKIFSGEVLSSPREEVPGFNGSETLMAIWNAGSGNGTLEDLQGMMSSMTNSLTTHIRQNGWEGFKTPATGEMYRITTCVHVRWAWMAYAGALVFLTLIFFFSMAVYARTNQSSSASVFQDFKSSLLPVLFHGFDGDSLKQLKHVSISNRQIELEKETEDIWISAVPTLDGSKISMITK
ncbi:hypothetical protein DM02DRAFT_543964 [Periconia macrospinosa]|uniref:Uncharacterized protein n=1 Tax=Periconia macrospinosa TaxID=97972 RepID=A0A2V1D2T3_9PLEO|nr:hypothetical protein DM02DRAFT_543964 [Periconia macrospinosa]